MCWDGASTVSATSEDDCEKVRISPARTWTEAYCEDAGGNQLASSVAGDENVCELVATGNTWAEGYCTATASSLNPVNTLLGVSAIDASTDIITLTAADPNIAAGDVLRLANADGQTCSATPLNEDLIVASVADTVVACTGTADTVGGVTPTCDLLASTDSTDACPAGCTETAVSVVTLEAGDGDVTAGDAGAATNCIVVRPLFSDQAGCETMATGDTWWHPQTYCDNCPAGSYDDDLDPSTPCLACNAGEFSLGRFDSCIDCFPGTVDEDRDPSTSCTSCQAGQYSGERATVCLDCLAGEKDQDSDPSTACVPCSAGQYSAARSTVCNSCVAGQADLDSDPSTPCEACAAGTYSPSLSTSCNTCAAGTVDDDSNPATSCVACSVGEYAAEGSTACAVCTGGQYDGDSNPATPCTGCSAGSETLPTGRCVADGSGQVQEQYTDELNCESERNTNNWDPATCTRNSDNAIVAGPDNQADCETLITGSHFYSAAFCTTNDGRNVDRTEADCNAAADSFWTQAGCGDERAPVDSDPSLTCNDVQAGDICPCEKYDSGASWTPARCTDGSGAMVPTATDLTSCEVSATTNEWRAGFCRENAAPNAVVPSVTDETTCEIDYTGRQWDGIGLCVLAADTSTILDRGQQVCTVSSDSTWEEGRCWATLSGAEAVLSIDASADSVTVAGTPTVTAGDTLQLASAPGQSCLATPAETDLVVDSVSGSVITFTAATVTLGDADASTNCVLRQPFSSTGQQDCEEIVLPRTWTDPGCYDSGGTWYGASSLLDQDEPSCTTEPSGNNWNVGVCTKADGVSLDTDATDETSCLVETTGNMLFTTSFCTSTDGTAIERTEADCIAATDSVWTPAGCLDPRVPTADAEAECFEQQLPNTWNVAECLDDSSAQVSPTPATEALCERDPTGNSWQPVGSFCSDCPNGKADLDSDGGAATACAACPSGSYSPVASVACESCAPGTWDDEIACTSNTNQPVAATDEADCLSTTGNTWFLTASTPCIACAKGRFVVDAVTNCAACAGGQADTDSANSGASPYCVKAGDYPEYVNPVDEQLCVNEATGNTWSDAGCVDAAGQAVAAANQAACETTGNSWDGSSCTDSGGNGVDAADYDACTATGRTWNEARCTDASGATTAAASQPLCEVQATGRSWFGDDRCIGTDGVTVESSFSDQAACEDTGNTWDTTATYDCTDGSDNEVAVSTEAECVETGRTWTAAGCTADDGTPLSGGEVCALLAGHTWVVQTAGSATDMSFHSAATPCVQCAAGKAATNNCVDTDALTVVGGVADQTECEQRSTDNTFANGVCTRNSDGVSVEAYTQADCEIEATGRYWGATECVACPIGKADLDNDASSPCDDCAAGQYSAGDTTTCDECAPGKASADPAVACADCSAGEYTAAGATTCAACDAGFEDDDSDPSTPCTDIDECGPAPCQNGGACTDSSAGNTWTGTACIDSNGDSVDGAGDEAACTGANVALQAYSCDCADGFGGSDCDQDTGPPVIVESEVSCNDVAASVDAGSTQTSEDTGALVLPAIDFTDNVPAGVTMTMADGDGTVVDSAYLFDVSTSTTVTATVQDAAGNSDTCSFDVTVVDDEAPTITGGSCPGTTAAVTDAGQSYASVDGSGLVLPSVAATDDQGVAPTIEKYVGSCATSAGDAVAETEESACTGSSTEVSTGNTWADGSCAYTNGDSATPEGLESECIEREDMVWTPASCTDSNGDSVIAASEAVCKFETTSNVWTALATVVDGATQFPIGDTVVTFVASDAADQLSGQDANTATCTSTVTVTDNQDPTIASGDCVDVQVATDQGKDFATVAGAASSGTDIVPTVTGSDNSGETLTAVATVSGVAVNDNTWDGSACADANGDPVAAATEAECATQFPLGATTVTYTATDGAGGTGQCTMTVTVVDEEVPVVDSSTCVAVSGTTDDGEAFGSTAYDVDLSYPGLAVTDNTVDESSLTTATYSRRCVVPAASDSDCQGEAAGYTWTPGTGTCTDDNAGGAEVDASLCYQPDGLIWLTASQLATGTSGVCLQRAAATQSDCELEATTHTWDGSACTDVNGDPVTALTDEAACTTVATGNSWVWVEVDSLTRFAIGDTELAIIVTDGINSVTTVGGTDSCLVTLTIQDDEAPALVGCTAVTGQTDDGVAYGTTGSGSVVLPSVTATDNNAATVAFETAPSCSDPVCEGNACVAGDCTGTWYAGGEAIGDDFQFAYLGTDSGSPLTTTVVFVATDDAQNEDRCDVIVTVEDDEAPVLACPAAMTVDADVSAAWVTQCNTESGCTAGQETGSARVFGLVELPDPNSVTDGSGETVPVTVSISATDGLGVTAVDAPTSGDASQFDPLSDFELDVFVDGSTRAIAADGGTRDYTAVYTATDAAANSVTCEMIVTVRERDDCDDNPCQNGGQCTDLIADTFGYHEDAGSRMQYTAEEYNGMIVRPGSVTAVSFSEWQAHVDAGDVLGTNSDPGYQCSCVRGWEGADCATDVDECGFASAGGSAGDPGAYHCLNTDNVPCSGPCENGAVCTDSNDANVWTTLVLEACVDTDSSGDDCTFTAGDSSTCGSGCDYTPPSGGCEDADGVAVTVADEQECLAGNIGINAYSCACEGSFSGPNCGLLDECASPGGLDPCYLSALTLPDAGTYSSGLLPTDRTFVCPVKLVCNDPDTSTTDDYTCSCPACVDAVFSSSEVDELEVFFSSHAAFKRKVATAVIRTEDPEEVCAVPDLQGCTDDTAVNYDASAVVDDGSCIAPVEGCMDNSATNYDSTATIYTYGTHSDGAKQCRQSDVAVDECADSPCNAPAHRLCQQAPGQPGTPCGDSRQSFTCNARIFDDVYQSEAFTCEDPNPYWSGDYVCKCQYDLEDGGYEPQTGLTCGDEELFGNPYRPKADEPPKRNSPVCIGTATQAATGCTYTASAPSLGQVESCVAPACDLTPGVDCSAGGSGCSYTAAQAAVVEACVDTDSSGDDCTFTAGDSSTCGSGCDYTPPSAAVEEACDPPACTFTSGDAGSCTGTVCEDAFLAMTRATGSDAASSCPAGCDYYDDECKSIGQKLCPGDGACVAVGTPCSITNYALTQLLKADADMASFLETRQRRPMLDRPPTDDEFEEWCPTEWAACDGDVTCAAEFAAIAAATGAPSAAAIATQGALFRALWGCAMAAVEAAYGPISEGSVLTARGGPVGR